MGPYTHRTQNRAHSGTVIEISAAVTPNQTPQDSHLCFTV